MKKLLPIIILSFILTATTVFLIWLYNEFITGLNPFLGPLFTLIILILAVPICKLLFKAFKKYISFSPGTLFLIAFFSYLIFLFALQMIWGNSALNIHLHDTYFVLPYSYFFFIAFVFSFFAAIYYWFAKIFKRQMNRPLGYIHFWLTFIGACIFFKSGYYVILADMPRRYYDYEDSSTLSVLNEQDKFLFIVMVILSVAQLLFLFNFCFSIFRGRKAA